MSPLMLIAFLVVAVIAFVIVLYNKMIKMRNQADEAWSDIDVQLKRRYNLIPNLVETVKGYATHEEGVFTKVTEARNMAINAGNMKEQAQAENMLSGALKSLFAVAENYPDLKANENFMQLQNELVDTEDKIQAARRFYNSTVRDFNTKLQQFPNSIVAKMFKFEDKEFFEVEDEEQRENVEVSFDKTEKTEDAPAEPAAEEATPEATPEAPAEAEAPAEEPKEEAAPETPAEPEAPAEPAKCPKCGGEMAEGHACPMPEKTEEAPAETPAEEPAPETPAEPEAPAEAPAEETPETPATEETAPAETPAESTPEAPVEEAAPETSAEETKEEAAPEAPAEPVAEAPAEPAPEAPAEGEDKPQGESSESGEATEGETDAEKKDDETPA